MLTAQAAYEAKDSERRAAKQAKFDAAHKAAAEKAEKDKEAQELKQAEDERKSQEATAASIKERLENNKKVI